MSSISTIFDNFTTLCETALSSYTRIPNPYLLEETNQLYLNKGLAIGFGPGVRDDLHLGCKISYQREFSVVLFNLVTTTDHNTTARVVLEKALLEDFITLREAVANDYTLSQSCIKIEYTDDSGIAFDSAETLKFMSMQINFNCVYEENI